MERTFNLKVITNTKLPIRKTDKILPNNFILANNRLITLEKQLDRNKKRVADYDKIIQNYIKEGIIERIDHFDKNTSLSRVHCLPHKDQITTPPNYVLYLMRRLKWEMNLL